LPRALEALAASSGSDWRIGDCTALSPAVDRPLAFYYLQPLIRSVRPSRPSPLSPAARRRATIEQHACVIMCFVSLLIAACTHGHGRPLCCTTVHVCLLVSGHYYYYPCSLHHFMHSRRLYTLLHFGLWVTVILIPAECVFVRVVQCNASKQIRYSEFQKDRVG
jgi:hypothetical protein